MWVSLNICVEFTACVSNTAYVVFYNLKTLGIYFSYFLMLGTVKFGEKCFIETYADVM
jgi:hypothetical protein